MLRPGIRSPRPHQPARRSPPRRRSRRRRDRHRRSWPCGAGRRHRPRRACVASRRARRSATVERRTTRSRPAAHPAGGEGGLDGDRPAAAERVDQRRIAIPPAVAAGGRRRASRAAEPCAVSSRQPRRYSGSPWRVEADQHDVVGPRACGRPEVTGVGADGPRDRLHLQRPGSRPWSEHLGGALGDRAGVEQLRTGGGRRP